MSYRQRLRGQSCRFARTQQSQDSIKSAIWMRSQSSSRYGLAPPLGGTRRSVGTAAELQMRESIEKRGL